jgi:hypothetical protein
MQFDPYRASRQFEREVFLGVPEEPEPNAERDFNGQTQSQFGRVSADAGTSVGSTREPDVLGTKYVDWETGEQFFLPRLG